jgi:hypothetical protein
MSAFLMDEASSEPKYRLEILSDSVLLRPDAVGVQLLAAHVGQVKREQVLHRHFHARVRLPVQPLAPSGERILSGFLVGRLNPLRQTGAGLRRAIRQFPGVVPDLTK